MSRWDDPRGPRYDAGRERGRREPGRRPEPYRYAARHDDWAEEQGWLNERRAAVYDQRADYGARYEDAGAAGYEQRGAGATGARYEDAGFMHDGEPYAYGGQEYGVEGHADYEAAHPSPGWGVEREDEERRRNFDFEDPGVGQSQAGYAFDARPPPGQDLDPEYVRWRNARLRAHDRDYEDWRRDQQRRYDEQYRRFLGERQRRPGESFQEWRAGRPADEGSGQDAGGR